MHISETSAFQFKSPLLLECYIPSLVELPHQGYVNIITAEVLPQQGIRNYETFIYTSDVDFLSTYVNYTCLTNAIAKTG